VELIIYTDGGARGNPGPAGIGIVIVQASRQALRSLASAEAKLLRLLGGGEEVVWEYGEYIGVATNNQAEYRALIRALEKAKELGATEVKCFLDSELLVKQLNREYRVKDKGLAPLFLRAWNLANGFAHASFTHIPREKNKRADSQVNRALDAHASGFDVRPAAETLL